MRISLSFFFCLSIYVALSQSNDGAKITLDSIVTSSDGFTFSSEKYKYNSLGQITQKITFDVFLNTKIYDYEYDKDGNKTSEITSYKYNEVDSLKFLTRLTFSYMESKIIETRYDWNTDSSDWAIRSQSIDYLNLKNRVDSTIYYNWDSQLITLKLSRKTYFEYDEEGNATLHLYSYRTSSRNGWQLSEKDEFLSDENNNLILHENYNWVDSTNSWVLDFVDKREYAYGVNNNILQLIKYNNANPYEKEIYFYDDLSNRYKEIHYSWDDINEEWFVEADDSISVTFNYNLDFEEIIFGDYQKNYLHFSSRPISAIRNLNFDDEYFPLKTIFYYSDFTKVGLLNAVQTEAKFYPNPAKNLLNFEKKINKLTIQDLTGKVRIQLYNPSKTVDVSELENGSYLLLLETDKGVVSEKLIISK